MKRVVILGGGIAAIEAAIFYRKEGFEVELVSERDYLFIYPISIWIPIGMTPFEYASMPLEKLAQRHGSTFTLESVVEISGSQKSITLKDSGRREVEYLVIAVGSGKMKHEGLEHTLSICGAPEQSVMLKKRIDDLIKKGSGKIALGFGGNPKDSSGVRGGPGFELLFNLHHQLTTKGIRDRFELTFFAPMAQPGARMGNKAVAIMGKMFTRNSAHNSAIALGLKKGEPKGYQEHLSILCVMDMGNGAGFVYRSDTKALLISMPIIGHWMKIAWGWYYKWSKMNFIPRIGGL